MDILFRVMSGENNRLSAKIKKGMNKSCWRMVLGKIIFGEHTKLLNKVRVLIQC